MRNYVNVECVYATCDITRMTNQPENPADQLRKLCERAGLTQEKLAKALGRSRASSVQRYFDPREFADKPLPYEFVTKVAKALVGRGAPPIEPEEVYALTDLSDLIIPVKDDHYERVTSIAKQIVAETGIIPGKDQWARTVLELYLSSINTPDDALEAHIRKDLVRKALRGRDA